MGHSQRNGKNNNVYSPILMVALIAALTSINHWNGGVMARSTSTSTSTSVPWVHSKLESNNARGRNNFMKANNVPLCTTRTGSCGNNNKILHHLQPSALLNIRGGQRNYDYNDSDDDGNSYHGNDYNNDQNDNYGRNYNDNRSSREYYNEDYGDYREENYSNGRDYNDYGHGRSSSSRYGSSKSAGNSKKSLGNMMPDVIKTGNKKVGLILLGGGGIFTMVGMSLFFNKSLMRIGNLLFIAGIPMTIGPGRTAGYFLQPKKARATGCLMAGIFLVMVGWPIFGIALEIFGLLNLFGNMFPVAMVLLKQLPGVGNLFNSNNSGGSRKQKKSQYNDNYRDQDYYSRGDDDRYQDDRDGASRYY